MEAKDIDAVFNLIHSINLPEELFVKDSLSHLQESIGESLVAFDKKELVGALVINEEYIDTIVSKKKGAASLLLRCLKGRYYAFVSPKNTASIALFEKCGLRKREKIIAYGYDRLVYEGVL